MTTYIVKGTGQRVTLSNRDFVASGGEKAVYRKGDTAYCVYHKPEKAIPGDKIRALAALTDSRIIKPVSELLDSNKQHCGETMPFVTDSWAPNDKSVKPLVLCQLFSNGFRRQHGVTQASNVNITDAMLAIMRHCHQHEIVIVDPNETNWLVSPRLDSVYLIDTSCCQTVDFPGTAIKLAIRDYSQAGFNKASDRFSLAVVIAWLWVGAHPYMVFHPDWQHLSQTDALAERMRKHVSMFDKASEFNRTNRPLADIPAALSRWLRSVLQDGQRPELPQHCGDVVSSVVSMPVAAPVATSDVILTMMARFPEDIFAVCDGAEVLVSNPRVIARTPVFDRRVSAKITAGALTLYDEDNSTALDVTRNADAVFTCDGRLYAAANTTVLEVSFFEAATRPPRVVFEQVGSIATTSALRVFTGGTLQCLLGHWLLSIFPKSGTCRQYTLPMLSGWQVLSAKYERGVFMVVAESGGNYKLLDCRLDDAGVTCRQLADTPDEVNFCVTSQGVCAVAIADGLRLFKVAPLPAQGAVPERRLHWPLAGAQLSSDGNTVLAADGGTLYRVQVK